MEQISIVFSRSSSKLAIFSWLIMLTEGTPYSHVAIKMSDSEISEQVYYQASHTMVNEMAEAEFLNQENIVYTFDFQVSSPIKLKLKEFAVNQLGVPYGVLSIVGLALVQVLKLFRVTIHNPFRDNGETYICSQFILTLLNNVEKIVLPSGTNINDITPKDLYPIIASLPKELVS